MRARRSHAIMLGASLLVLLAACSSAPEQQGGVQVPAALRSALGATLTAIRGTLDVYSGTTVVASFGPVEADEDGVIRVSFADVPVGTYDFVVRISADAGAVTDMPLLVYREVNVVIGEGSANNRTSSGGTWELVTSASEAGDADGDGLDNLSEIVFGLDPASRFSLVFAGYELAPVIDVVGHDPRGLFVFQGGGVVMFLGSQAARPATLADLATTPPLPQQRTVTWSNMSGPCAQKTVRGLQVVRAGAGLQATGGLVAVGDGGCVLSGRLPEAYADLATQGFALSPRATDDTASTGFSGDWAQIAIGGFSELDERYVMLLDSAGQARLERWPAALWDYNQTSLTLGGTNIHAASGASFASTLEGCGMAMPLAVQGEKLFLGTGTAYLGASGEQLLALASWADQVDGVDTCHVLAARHGAGGAELVGASCALEQVTADGTLGASCNLSLDGSPDTPGPYALPSGMGQLTAMAIGRSPMFPEMGPQGPKDVLFVADDLGRVWAAPSAVEGTADWTLVGTAPDGRPVRRLIAARMGHADVRSSDTPEQHQAAEEAFLAAGWLDTLVVATDRNVYRMP